MRIKRNKDIQTLIDRKTKNVRLFFFAHTGHGGIVANDGCVFGIEGACPHHVVAVECQRVDPMAVAVEIATQDALYYAKTSMHFTNLDDNELRCDLKERSYIATSPHFDGAILRRAVDEVGAAPAQACDRLRVTAETAHARVHHRVPYLDRGVLGRAGQVATLLVSFVVGSYNTTNQRLDCRRTFSSFRFRRHTYKCSGCQHK